MSDASSPACLICCAGPSASRLGSKPSSPAGCGAPTPSPISLKSRSSTLRSMRTYSTESLRELGYSVVEAPNARAALQVLEAHAEVAVMFTDIGLPGGMNGRQLAEEARKRHPTIKVLFTTGYARNAIVHDGRL